MAEGFVDAVEWARTVGPDEPHELRDVEDVLLQDHPGNQARAQRKTLTPDFAPFWVLYAAAPLLPVAGPIIFVGGWYHGRTLDPTSINDGLPWVGLVFWLVTAFFLHELVGWWRHRFREGVLVGFAAFDVVMALVTLAIVRDGLDHFHGNAALHLTPIWATAVLAAVTALLHAVSPSEGRSRMSTRNLTEESRTQLLRERTASLQILAERGMLPAQDVAPLSKRPLGKLHRSKKT